MVEDGEAALIKAFEEIGESQLFPAAEAQEICDLADSRRRSRGQKVRRKRLERGWLILSRVKRARFADEQVERLEGRHSPTPASLEVRLRANLAFFLRPTRWH